MLVALALGVFWWNFVYWHGLSLNLLPFKPIRHIHGLDAIAVIRFSDEFAGVWPYFE